MHHRLLMPVVIMLGLKLPLVIVQIVQMMILLVLILLGLKVLVPIKQIIIV